MNSVILINKPVNYRSSKCVAVVKKKLGVKVGHCGTLDASASGLLVLLTGRAARLSEYVMSLPKVYRVTIQFGAETDTYDYTGSVTNERGYSCVDVDILRTALYSFSGYRMQTPPAISALKIGGKPAHKLARSGKDIEMKERPVYFRHISVIEPFSEEYGTIVLEVECGRGTYIRSLAKDLGDITGSGAYVKSLERVSSGNFSLSEASEPEEFKLLPLSRLAENFSRIYISGRDEISFTNGMSILLRNAVKVMRGVSMNGSICVEGSTFLGFGTYAGYDYIKPDVIVPKDELC